MNRQQFEELKIVEARIAELKVLKAFLIEAYAASRFSVKVQVSLFGSEKNEILTCLGNNRPDSEWFTYDRAQIIGKIDIMISDLEKKFDDPDPAKQN